MEIEKFKIMNLVTAANAYMEKTGTANDLLFATCEKLIDSTENQEAIEKHNKIAEKESKKLERKIRDASYDFASLNDDKTISKDASGNLKFTVENQKAYNAKTDQYNDEYVDLVETILKEKMEFFIPKIKKSLLPVSISKSDFKALELLIDTEND